MAFKWKRLTLFGLSIGVPALVFLARKIEEAQLKAFDAHKEKLFACVKCNRLFPHHCIAMMQHLKDSHGIGENDSIEVVSDLYKKFKAAQFKRWENVI